MYQWENTLSTYLSLSLYLSILSFSSSLYISAITSNINKELVDQEPILTFDSIFAKPQSLTKRALSLPISFTISISIYIYQSLSLLPPPCKVCSEAGRQWSAFELCFESWSGTRLEMSPWARVCISVFFPQCITCEQWGSGAAVRVDYRHWTLEYWETRLSEGGMG